MALTSQHATLAIGALEPFGIVPDVDLAIMSPAQSPTSVAALVLQHMEGLLEQQAPDAIVVQGDTTTTLATMLAGFHARIPVAHVEAGLRSHDMEHPFPEEANRRIATILASLHLAPTERASQNLLAEGVDPMPYS